MRLYRLLVRLCLPPAFRREWGAEMVRQAGAEWADARARGASWRAVLHLGGDLLVTAVREWRDAWANLGTGGGMSGMWDDVRIAARGLLRVPGYTAAAVATLAVATAVNSVVFGVVDGTLLRPLPYDEPDRLVAVWSRENWSREMLDLARDELRGARAVAGYGGVVFTLAEGGSPVELFGLQVSPGLHTTLGVAPVVGRGFTAQDGLPGAEPVALLSHELWVDRFGSDATLVGRSIDLGAGEVARRTVVGIMPPGYRSPVGEEVAAWIPVVTDPAASDYAQSYFMDVVARLAPGTELASFRDEVRRWAATVQERRAGWLSPEQAAAADAVLLADAMVAGRRTPALLALGGVLLVLLVACANLANLVLARTSARERELSVRAALGAHRRRTFRLLLSETAVLGVAGAGVGLCLAAGLQEAMVRLLPALVPPDRSGLGLRPLVATLVVVVGAGMAAGVGPAAMASSGDPARRLGGARGSTAGRRGLRLQGGLVALQLALATTLVASAALLGRSLGALAAVDPGFQPRGAVTFRLTAPPSAYPGDDDVIRFFQDVREALARVPGVEQVGFVSRLPLAGGISRITAYPEGIEVPEGGRPPQVDHRLVTPGYLPALGARLRAGRGLEPADDQDAEVVPGIVNRAAAERFWPGEDAVGKLFLGPGQVPWLRVVGVVEDIHETAVERAVEPALYILHRDWPWRTMSAVVRTRGEADLRALEAAVWSVSPVVALSTVRTLERVASTGFARVRAMAVLAVVLGGVALVLGVLGVYGVVAYATGRRRREFAVRTALGAHAVSLQGLELRRAARLVALGVAVGVPAAWVVGRSMRAVLFGVEPYAPLVLGPVAALLAGAALVAAWIPVRRATRVDPVAVLQQTE